MLSSGTGALSQKGRGRALSANTRLYHSAALNAHPGANGTWARHKRVCPCSHAAMEPRPCSAPVARRFTLDGRVHRKRRPPFGRLARGSWRASGPARPRAFIAVPLAQSQCAVHSTRATSQGAASSTKLPDGSACACAYACGTTYIAYLLTSFFHQEATRPPAVLTSACLPSCWAILPATTPPPFLPLPQSRTYWLHHCSTTTSHSRPTAAATTTTSTHVRIPLHSKLHRCSRFRFLRPGISRSRPANKRADRRLSSILDQL